MQLGFLRRLSSVPRARFCCDFGSAFWCKAGHLCTPRLQPFVGFAFPRAWVAFLGSGVVYVVFCVKYFRWPLPQPALLDVKVSRYVRRTRT